MNFLNFNNSDQRALQWNNETKNFASFKIEATETFEENLSTDKQINISLLLIVRASGDIPNGNFSNLNSQQERVVDLFVWFTQKKCKVMKISRII